MDTDVLIFWVVTPCSVVVGYTDISEDLVASCLRHLRWFASFVFDVNSYKLKVVYKTITQ